MSPIPECGTYNGRRRHQRRNETCTTCNDLFEAARQARLAPCGTKPAYRRHRKEGETCQTCDTIRRENVEAANATTAEVIAEIEFLLKAGEGEHRILTALGYVGRYNTLKSRLFRAGRQDLITRIFNGWELAA